MGGPARPQTKTSTRTTICIEGVFLFHPPTHLQSVLRHKVQLPQVQYREAAAAVPDVHHRLCVWIHACAYVYVRVLVLGWHVNACMYGHSLP